MNSLPYEIRLEQPGDAEMIDQLHADLFGPERFKRAAYVLRDGIEPDPDLTFVATLQGRLIASVRMTPITIGGRPAHLLGPLVVDPAYKARGLGKMLVAKALEAACEHGHKLVLLVGDLPYYGPLGFTFLGEDVITLPAWVDKSRVLVAGLTPDALEGLSGPAERLGGNP